MKLVAEYESIPPERTLQGTNREAYELLCSARKPVLEIELTRNESLAAVKRAFQVAAKAAYGRIRFQTDANKATVLFVQWLPEKPAAKDTSALRSAKFSYAWSDADVEKSAAALGYDVSKPLTEQQVRAARKRITDFYKKGDLEGAFQPKAVAQHASR